MAENKEGPSFFLQQPFSLSISAGWAEAQAGQCWLSHPTVTLHKKQPLHSWNLPGTISILSPRSCTQDSRDLSLQCPLQGKEAKKNLKASAYGISDKNAIIFQPVFEQHLKSESESKHAATCTSYFIDISLSIFLAC